MNSKYAKYSTEQLEVIFTHLADPAEKELVKKELSQRYYQHYLNLTDTPEDQPQPLEPSVREALAPGNGDIPDETGAAGTSPPEHPEDEALAGLVAVEPITLPSPVEPGTASDRKHATPSTSKKRGCFIATAAYGSPLAREVVLLQHFRDEYLSRTAFGPVLIRTYYRLSPCLAELIINHQVLSPITRGLLAPLIFLIKKCWSNPPK